MARFLFAVAAGAWLLFSAGGALALSLDEARARGLVGETPRGYIAAVQSSPSPEVSALVSRVNAGRRSEYQRVAESTGSTLRQVEALAAQKIIRQLPPGSYVQGDNGRWGTK